MACTFSSVLKDLRNYAIQIDVRMKMSTDHEMI